MTDPPGHAGSTAASSAQTGFTSRPFDRGFQLGDGVFETLRARGGRPTELEEHVARLRRSADGLFDPPRRRHRREPGGRDRRPAGRRDPRRTGRRRQHPHHGSRGAVLRSRLAPTGRASVADDRGGAGPVPPTPASHLERGLHLVASRVRRDPENPLSALKTTSRADYVYARVEARNAGADDALFLTTDGFLSEATSANVLLVRGSELATPGLGCAILPGTTRDWILRWASGAGLQPSEARLTPRDLAEADEAFLSSSVAGILPVTRFEDEPIGAGMPGYANAARPRRSRGVHRPRIGRRIGSRHACARS